ncbi:prepilin-type N-terminal cleavage/methylation domain-containing protein [Undibacterium sp. Di26W]|uniref:prepilin-type N-terminal cleavage/methylation domain-containing protein n=1 Tax=Undibacterium sp. Di26W TaxID=3413035 RepID=UPI003BF3EE49
MQRKHPSIAKCSTGFTLIELLVVLAILALLATLTIPRYFQSIDKGKETVLLENLRTTRESIDKFYADTARYPDSLSELVERKYLKALPIDPITESASTWLIIPPAEGQQGQVYNLQSGAQGQRADGKPYRSL